MDIQINKLTSDDVHSFSKLIEVFALVFEMEALEIPGENQLQGLLNKPDFFALVATVENNLIGGLTVYVLHSYYSGKRAAYIYDVGVLADYQRKGVGKKLIDYLTSYCQENGFEEAFVQAENTDIHAVNFYRTTSFKYEVQTTQFVYPFEQLNDEPSSNFN